MTTAKGLRPLLYIDCFAGIAGDMMLGALLDLDEGCAEAVQTALSSLDPLGYELTVEEVERSGIGAKRVIVDVDQARQPGRSLTDIEALLRDSSLLPAVLERALTIFRALAEAEGAVHRKPAAEVHFHEVGAVDSIVDIVGAAAGLEFLGAEIAASPVPLGRGFVKCRHGNIPLPAPATLALLRGVPVEGTTIDTELVTPTGAAILATQATTFGALPQMSPRAIGWGAGTRDHDDRPGLLRLVLGEGLESSAAPQCDVLEANIDDMTGEVAAHCLDRILEAGALDVWFTPIVMKKGRPAIKLSILCRRQQRETMADLLLRESTTIGLRHFAVGRIELQREMVEVETTFGAIPVKLAKDQFGTLKNFAPELDACRAAAAQHDAPLKTVLAAVAAAAFESLTDK